MLARHDTRWIKGLSKALGAGFAGGCWIAAMTVADPTIAGILLALGWVAACFGLVTYQPIPSEWRANGVVILAALFMGTAELIQFIHPSGGTVVARAAFSERQTIKLAPPGLGGDTFVHLDNLATLKHAILIRGTRWFITDKGKQELENSKN